MSDRSVTFGQDSLQSLTRFTPEMSYKSRLKHSHQSIKAVSRAKPLEFQQTLIQENNMMAGWYLLMTVATEVLS